MELTANGLAARGWTCRMIQFPALDRASTNRFARLTRYVAASFAASVRLIGIALQRSVVLHLSPGQSLPSLLKVSPMLLAISWLRPRLPRVVSLHGSVFLNWRCGQLVARVFRFLLQRTDIVTVLSRRQHDQLVTLGVHTPRIIVLPNTCNVPACSDVDLARKSWSDSRRRPLRLLHLSLLIESKGFPEYLEALQLLAERNAGPIEAVLCGPISFSGYCRRFTTPAIKEKWIYEKLDVINASRSVHVRWVQGAAGAAKQALLKNADVFVFPSRFPVEAQPLVLLEAMASGCTIVTSTVGEISSTLDERSAILLARPTATNVATAIEDIMVKPDLAAALARTARDRYVADFDRQRYTDRWATIFLSLNDRKA